MTPEEVSQHESIFAKGSSLRWQGSAPLAKASIGVPLQKLLNAVSPSHTTTGSVHDPKMHLQQLTKTYIDEKHLLWFNVRTKEILIVIKEGADSKSLLKAWAHALVIAHRYSEDEATCASVEGILELVRSSLEDVSSQFDKFLKQSDAAGWDTEIGSLETTSATRLRLSTKSDKIGPSS